MNILNLNEKAEKYALSKEILDKRENDRLSFIEKFPLEKLSSLQIDEFVQGTDENSFCYWLEFKKIGFGIGGGNASKFGLYKTVNNGQPVYAVSYGKNKQFLDYESAQNFYAELLSKILKSLDYTKSDEIEKIKDLKIPMWNMILLKILSIYYPEKFLTIGSPTVLINCAKEIGLTHIDISPGNSIQINYECKKAITNNSMYASWPNEKIGSFIWETFDGEEEKKKKNATTRFFLVGAFWDGSSPSDQTSRFLENGIWENGYDDKFIEEVKSLSVGSKIAIKAVFTREKTKSVMAIKARGVVQKNFNDGKKLNIEWEKDFLPFEVEFTGGYWATIKEVTDINHIDQIFKTLSKIEPNSFDTIKNKFDPAIFENYIYHLKRILQKSGVKQNDNRVVYSVRDKGLNFTVGQRYSFNLFLNYPKGPYGVISKEKLNESSLPFEGHHPQPFYTHFMEFKPSDSDWKNIMEAVSEELNRTTRSGYSRFNNTDFENYLFDEKTVNKSDLEMTKHPLNCILYGPPGTGKTHYTVLRAAEIIENRTITSYDEALNIFKANLHNQIEFITFHQNYSYEDFIQGLRPDTDNNASLVFDKKDGVFLKIATDALFEYYKGIKSNQENTGEQDIDLNEAYLDFIEHLKNIENKYFETSTGSVIHISGFSKNDNIEFKHGDSSRNYLVSANRLLKLYHIFPDIKHIKNVHNDIRDAIGGCNTTVYWVALKEFISFINNVNKKINIEETNIEKYDEIGYESKKKLLSTVELDTLRQVPNSTVKNYVIIIDEINRANISRVFGELITLIESDKRSHGNIPLETKLPSGDTFVVPSNLYIIGTMNTADKSIALLDIALRRRFEFEAMYPKYKIDNQEIYDVEILEKINARIVKTKGHDFQIGHAYFMGENNDLKKRMNNKVIPLLLEYYMNDENEVKAILQSAGLVIEENSWPLRIKGNND